MDAASQLVARLRQTLGQQAAALQPSPDGPPWRCPLCSRVSVDGGDSWHTHPERMAGEIEIGCCAHCRVQRDAARKHGEWEADEQARQDRRDGKTYGPAPEGEDVFRGFRGEGDSMGSEVVAVPVASSLERAKPAQTSGAMALASMGDSEFEARLDSAAKAIERARQIQRRILHPDEDYGVIPGTKKPTLLKPGAEKLCAFYGLVATYEMRTTYGDDVATPHVRVEAKAVIHMGSEAGPVVGEGYGSASSWESKHRYRSAKRSCPACGSVGAIGKSKYPDRETGDIGWYCRECKANFRSDDAAITEQALGQVQNADPADVENTVLKMAKKRAFIDGTLTTTATSGLFTQDLEDSADVGGGESEAPKAPAASTSRAPAPARSSSPAPAAPATGAKPACAKCHTNAKVIVGKYPDKRTKVQKPWYCLTCKTTWGNSELGPDPGSEPWDGEPIDEPADFNMADVSYPDKEY